MQGRLGRVQARACSFVRGLQPGQQGHPVLQRELGSSEVGGDPGDLPPQLQRLIRRLGRVVGDPRQLRDVLRAQQATTRRADQPQREVNARQAGRSAVLKRLTQQLHIVGRADLQMIRQAGMRAAHHPIGQLRQHGLPHKVVHDAQHGPNAHGDGVVNQLIGCRVHPWPRPPEQVLDRRQIGRCPGGGQHRGQPARVRRHSGEPLCHHRTHIRLDRAGSGQLGEPERNAARQLPDPCRSRSIQPRVEAPGHLDATTSVQRSQRHIHHAGRVGHHPADRPRERARRRSWPRGGDQGHSAPKLTGGAQEVMGQCNGELVHPLQIVDQQDNRRELGDTPVSRLEDLHRLRRTPWRRGVQQRRQPGSLMLGGCQGTYQVACRRKGNLLLRFEPVDRQLVGRREGSRASP
jgi:hypothetical protein